MTVPKAKGPAKNFTARQPQTGIHSLARIPALSFPVRYLPKSPRKGTGGWQVFRVVRKCTDTARGTGGWRDEFGSNVTLQAVQSQAFAEMLVDTRVPGRCQGLNPPR